MSEVTIPNSRVFGKNTVALAEFFEKGKQGLAVVFATPEGNFLSPKAVANLLTTAHTEWRENAKKEIDDLHSQWEHVDLDDVQSLPFLQPPKDTV